MAKTIVKNKTATKYPPMLATLVNVPFHEKGWIYELKWDGYRAVSFLDRNRVDIRSRNDKSFNEKFYPLYDELLKLNRKMVLDGEIVVIDENGFPDFSALQNWRSEADGQLIYYVFDLLSLNGRDITQLPLRERRKKLREEISNKGMIRISEPLKSTGTELFAIAQKMGIEGIIAKREDSRYLPGKRSREWLKIKTEKRQEFVIGGYTINENTSKKFSALLVGVFENNALHFVSPVGTGFDLKQQEEILKKLRPLKTSKCPFVEEPDYNAPSRFRPNPPKAKVTWVQPKLVAEVSFRELTPDGSIRHPSFKGLREDKAPNEVRRENPENTAKLIGKEKTVIHNNVKAVKQSRATLLNPKEETQVRSIGGHELKFGNLSKVYWPKEKYTKRDMLNYYYQVAPYILPHLKDRPQTLNRYPNGINGESFYQKDVKGKVPEWITTFPYYSEADEREKEFIVCSNEASLLYIAALGCIEMNPWSSRMQKPDHPDWCIIDLDPDKNPFEQVITTARVAKDILDSLGVQAWCKTSGSTGLHVYIPLGGKYTYEQSKEFARKLAKLIHAELPEFTSIERLTGNRKGKLYIDFLQNRPQATVASAYSLRPKPGATVSAPLHWEEVKKGLKMEQFTIRNMIPRVKEIGDIFKPVLGKGIDLKKAEKQIKI